MILENGDLYRVVEQVSRRLDQDGENGIAAELREAMLVSGHPGEVLEEIGAALDKVRKSRAYRSPDVRTDVEDAIHYIDRVLG